VGLVVAIKSSRRWKSTKNNKIIIISLLLGLMNFLATIGLIAKLTLHNIPFFEDLVLYITIHG
jgi:hypothetical protein